LLLFKSFDTIVSFGISGVTSIGGLVALILFAWLCQIPLFAAYHLVFTKIFEAIEQWQPELRRYRQVGSWSHWREGLNAVLVLLVTTTIVATVAYEVLPRQALYDFMRSPFNLVAMVTVAAYLYNFNLGKRLKKIVIFGWPFFAVYCKVQTLSIIPLITGIPLVLLGLIVGDKIPIVIVLLILCWPLGWIVGFAVSQYGSAHFVNWIAKRLAVGAPGYNKIQRRMNWEHTRTVNHSSFIHHRTSWRLAANDMTFLIYANVLTSLLYVPVLLNLPKETPEQWQFQAVLYGNFWTLIAGLLWHFWGWYREVKIASGQHLVKPSKNKPSKKPEKRRSPSPPARSIGRRSPNLRPVSDPTEAELDQVAIEFFGDFDATPVTQPPPTRKPEPEKPEWYVFRSGKSEGPYTKDQLRDAQKITARTKVRRGESEWQRAGDIPELVSYLTQK
jgi:hypothetical protein